MELMQGYKQTEVGVIPEDWKLMSIDQIFNFYSTSNYSKAQMLTDGEIGCFHYGLIHSLPNNNYDIRNGLKYYVTKEQGKYEYLKEGDVVMVDASEDLSGINKSIEISGVKDKLYIAGLHTFLLRDKGFYQKNFRGPILNSYFTKAQFYRLAVGMKVYGVSKQQLKTVSLPVPTKPEQTAIALALSDKDAYITSLEKLIKKKSQIRQGAMQELLKPKDGWKDIMLTDLVDFIHGKAHEQFIVENGRYTVVNSKFVSSDGRVAKFSNYSFLTAKKNDVLTVLSDLPNGKALAKCFFVDLDNQYAVNQRICIWRSKNVDPKFLFYVLNRHPYFLALNDGVSQTHILNHHIKKCQISIPLNKAEQENIGQILTSIDEDLRALKTKLEKAKSIKQGMMQNLLTGKIRLL